MIVGPKLRRSLLYVPASNPRAMEKARGLPCDAVILDLEDAVAPSEKTEARGAAAAALAAGGFRAREVIVRVNALDTPWGADDLRALRSSSPDAVLAPKIESAADIAAYAAAQGDTAPLWAMIETCGAVLNLDLIAGAAGLEAMVFGANDLLSQMGAAITADRGPLHAALGLTVTAARAHGRAVFDGVFNDLDDPEGFAAECAQGAAFGFDGKTLIHPKQIEACHTAFAPGAAAVDEARAIVAAFEAPENARAGVLTVNGRMAERLHLEAARRLLAIHEAASRPDPA